ncbi:SRPBCC family protein [Flavobacterium poyangense]|uniref:SRPBCC family protein n=1 Tax=Flavobacterium poyangense TaxID=2204302 RepID=UPI0014200CAC|nr:SRPBCC domain-containing protein [Flavobacterium sp. JXAS1]
MSAKDFTTTLLMDHSPEAVFNAITNVRGWWSEEIEGNTTQLNEVFNYHYEDVHRCKIKLIEVIPNQKIVWLIEENYFKFTEDKKEWTGTKPTFEINKKEDKTELRFTHVGLVPDYECFEICRDSWTNYIQNSLKNLITTGKGQPNGKDKPQTENEKRLSEK